MIFGSWIYLGNPHVQRTGLEMKREQDEGSIQTIDQYQLIPHPRYEALALRSMLNSLPGFSWCTNPTCSSGQIQPQSPDPSSTHPSTKFTCLSCGHIHCTNHPTTPYHFDSSCAAFDARVAKDGASRLLELERVGERMVREIGRRCPNAMCGYWIEKMDGCDVVTCWKCGWRFCWECGARIDRRGGRFHREGCKWY
ncbi:hypothetical protein BCR34DRAFT_574484 [Clohesyomyces aquaticus]|uniref:RBR-type E3 ubiquitin transferase n=1 Tax=Clohesyomyces aquaticus TaxID=1231657 RepID=A0A1Y1YVC5_9PLEO|nr:hypothetical protein BCR34DRAFT_574484 [Clohesyomyces aquaticus]